MVESSQARVLQVLGSSAGGVARHVAQVAEALGADTEGETGSIVQVAGPGSVRDVVAPVGSAVRFTAVEISDRPGPGDVTSLRRLRDLARGADVVHAHGLRAGALVIIATRCLRGAPPVVVTLHNLPVGPRSVRAVSFVLERLVSRHADAVLGVSLDLVDRARQQGASHTGRALVPAPSRPDVECSTNRVRSDLGVPAGARLLVTVGRLAPQKGLDTLCDAAAILDTAGVSGGVVWVVAGDGPLREQLQGRIDAERLPVRLLGFRDDAPDLMAAAEVVVSTAVWEGQPIWLQEALGLGSAVVTTDAGGTREVTGDAAVLVSVGDAPAVAAGVVDLLTDGGRRDALAAAALAQASTLPSVADVVGSLTDLYATLRSERGRADQTSRARPSRGIG
ncbi:glycosyltransferase family 4 protein [Sanguibacter antarcticus]|uniref:D-inositol 3-phosphate glycosyltransferase n=1 Tax=Sanguibacter antarcticus TaxID=372484 RepID=A0A2A9E5F4_9MICO|nr:glycosyltransferase family 4 protein [Sanguibacter antarcticus]PFG33400.1 glycosyltransferase involved in cell wall biosynthesis [Sanguibacter antarcticus]